MAKFPTLNKTDPHTLAPCCTPPSTLTTMHKPNVQFQGLLRDHFPKLEGGEDILEIVFLFMAKLPTLDSRPTHNGHLLHTNLIQFYPILSNPLQSHPISSHLISSPLIPSNPIQSYPILTNPKASGLSMSSKNCAIIN